MSSFNIFVDRDGIEIERFNIDNAYDATAVADFCSDSGYQVETDMWGAEIPYAMVSPKVFEKFGLFRFI